MYPLHIPPNASMPSLASTKSPSLGSRGPLLCDVMSAAAATVGWILARGRTRRVRWSLPAGILEDKINLRHHRGQIRPYMIHSARPRKPNVDIKRVSRERTLPLKNRRLPFLVDPALGEPLGSPTAPSLARGVVIC